MSQCQCDACTGRPMRGCVYCAMVGYEDYPHNAIPCREGHADAFDTTLGMPFGGNSGRMQESGIYTVEGAIAKRARVKECKP